MSFILQVSFLSIFNGCSSSADSNYFITGKFSHLDFKIYTLIGNLRHKISEWVTLNNVFFIHTCTGTFKNTVKLVKPFFPPAIRSQKRDLCLKIDSYKTTMCVRHQTKCYFKLGTFGSNSPPYPGKGQIPHPREGLSCEIPYCPGTQNSQIPGVCLGGCWSFELISA